VRLQNYSKAKESQILGDNTEFIRLSKASAVAGSTGYNIAKLEKSVFFISGDN
jgi:hypothetical protein